MPLPLPGTEELPADFPTGCLYRILPGQLVYARAFAARTHPNAAPVQLRQVTSPVDGDGYVMKLEISRDPDTGAARVLYGGRFVDSFDRRVEASVGRPVFQAFSFRPTNEELWRDGSPRSVVAALLGGIKRKGAFNTGVMTSPAGVIPLSEDQPAPYALSRENLSTVTRRGALPGLPGLWPRCNANTQQTVTAHPKIDPESGLHYLYGVVPMESPFTGLRLGTFDGQRYRHGCFLKPTRSKLTLDGRNPLVAAGRPLIEKLGMEVGESTTLSYFSQPHEIAMAGPYLCIPFHPISIDLERMGQAGVEDAMSWDAGSPSELVVVDRSSWKERARFDLDPPLAAFHWPWGRMLDDDTLVLVTVEHDGGLETALGDGLERGMLDGVEGAAIGGRLVRLTLDLDEGRVERHVLSEVPVELPTTDRRFEGDNSESLYCVAQVGPEPRMNALQRIEVLRGGVQTYVFPEGDIVSEPTFLPVRGGERSGKEDAKGYLVTVVHREAREGRDASSYVAVLDPQKLEQGPLATLPLPDPVPFGLHTLFEPSR